MMKSLMPWCGIDLHDVPENRLAADLDHRLGPGGGFFGDAGAESTGEDDGFHWVNLRENMGSDGWP